MRNAKLNSKPKHVSLMVNKRTIKANKARAARPAPRPRVKGKPKPLVLSPSKSPLRVNLFTSYYHDNDMHRQVEIDRCIALNANESTVNAMFIIGEKPIHVAATHIPLNVRPTFNHFFEFVNKHTNARHINVICNTDIYFPAATINILKGIDLPSGMCLALSRWDDTPAGIKPFCRRDSQDVWIFRGKIQRVAGGFYQGKLGCDNRLAHEIAKAGYSIHNPCLTLKAVHLHRTGKRNWVRTPKDVVPKPYKFLHPIKLEIR